jgi:hypothetical protein
MKSRKANDMEKHDARIRFQRWLDANPDYWAPLRKQDKKFQAAMRAAGIPEGVNTDHPDSIAVRLSPTRLDVLKSSLA